MTTSELPIVEVDYGIANNFGTYIEVNKNLKKYPKLFEQVLKHERSHTPGFFTLHDLKLDFVENSGIRTAEMFHFMSKNPKSLTQFLPVYYTKRQGIVFDLNMLIMYSFFFIVFFAIFYLGGVFL